MPVADRTSPLPLRSRSPTLTFNYDDSSQLHSLAERIHNAADELPLSDAVHSGNSSLDNLDERVRDIAGLLTHLASAAAFADRTVRRSRDPEADLTRLKVTQLTHAAGAVGHALADLGDAVAHTGALHQLAAAPRSTQRSTTIESTRALLHARIDSTRSRLNKAGARLHQAADRLTAPPRSTSPHVTTPAPRPSPATSRTR